jgi:hypothetical protein
MYFIETFSRGTRNHGVYKKSIRLSMVSLAFTTQAISCSQMFPGLIQHLWCDLFECSSNLVPQTSNVSWVLSVHTVLDITPNKKVRWAQVGWIGRPSSGSPTTTPIFIEILVKELTHLHTSTEHRSHICTSAASLSHHLHISLSAAMSAPFWNFCDSGASTGPGVQWRICR